MMIHKIEPHKYYPEFRSQDPKPSDYLLLFDGEKVYLPSHTENSDVTDTSADAGISEYPQVYLPTLKKSMDSWESVSLWNVFSGL